MTLGAVRCQRRQGRCGACVILTQRFGRVNRRHVSCQSRHVTVSTSHPALITSQNTAAAGRRILALGRLDSARL